jgi:2'-deoxynucleoside 5'-phosphate N-hydrolase
MGQRRIYFAGSIRGGQQDAHLYKQLIGHLNNFGTVLTEHVGDITKSMQKSYSESDIWQEDMAWLRTSDVVVCECTVTSLGVGYEIGIAESLKIPILVLFRKDDAPRPLSAMITGNPHVKLVYYDNLDQAIVQITSYFGGLNLK